MPHKATTPAPRSAKRPEMLQLEREARKETIEHKGKNYRFWLFRRKLCQIALVYALIIGLIGSIVFLWTNYILKYDWISTDTVTLTSNGLFNKEQAFAAMHLKPEDNIFSIPAAELEQRLLKCPAIRRASVKHLLSPNSTLNIDIDARIPAAWIECPDLGILPGNTGHGVLADRDGVIFPCVEPVHIPFLKGKSLPRISLRPPASGSLNYGVPVRELEAPMQLMELLSGSVTEFLPGIVSVSTPNEWSFCVYFSNDCKATFSHYGLEQQVDRLLQVLEHARQTHRKISAVNLIPEHNIPVVFDGEYESIPLAEPVEE